MYAKCFILVREKAKLLTVLFLSLYRIDDIYLFLAPSHIYIKLLNYIIYVMNPYKTLNTSKI